MIHTELSYEDTLSVTWLEIISLQSENQCDKFFTNMMKDDRNLNYFLPKSRSIMLRAYDKRWQWQDLDLLRWAYQQQTMLEMKYKKTTFSKLWIAYL